MHLLSKWFLFVQDAMLMTKERELKEAVREGRDRVGIFAFSVSFALVTDHGKELKFTYIL